MVDRSPFDKIIVKKSEGGDVLEVLPLELDGRRVPNPFPAGMLTVRLLSNPGTELQVSWNVIQTVHLYEAMLVTEVDRLVKEKDFSEAYDYFALLNKDYSDTPGLKAKSTRYLLANAQQAFKNNQYDHALAILQSLYEQDPSATKVGIAVDSVAEKIILEHQKRGDWQAARGVLDFVEKGFKGAQVSVVQKWRKKLKEEAENKLREGVVALRAGRFREARDAAHAAAGILPSHPSTKKLLAAVAQRYPTLVVGVRSRCPGDLSPRLDLQATLRTSRLARRTLTELSRYSAEGGVYTSPLGSIAVNESATNLTLSFPEQQDPDTAFAVARLLLQATNPGSPINSRALEVSADSIRVPTPWELELTLKRPHIRPAALLRYLPIQSSGIATPNGFDLVQSTPQKAVFTARSTNTSIVEVEERFFGNDAEALQALSRGDIGVIDRLMPWQVEAVRKQRSLAVGEYDLPTVHVLLPSPGSKLLDKRPMRRALQFAINRRQIMNELILGGRRQPGFEVISGPFPTGKSLTDPVRYGYNDGVEARIYDPSLGAILSSLAWTQVQRAEHGKEDDADRPFPTLRLAHGTDPVARGACQSIQTQLTAVGIPIELVELDADAIAAQDAEYDLRYAELCVWEPLTDAATLLGPGGIAGRCSDPMVAALGRVDRARNWVEVSAALRAVHALAAGDLPVIPLWQTVNFYAYRRDLKNVPDATVTLYQSIDDWKQ